MIYFIVKKSYDMPQIGQWGLSFASGLIRLFDCDLWNVGFHSSSVEVQLNTTE